MLLMRLLLPCDLRPSCKTYRRFDLGLKSWISCFSPMELPRIRLFLALGSALFLLQTGTSARCLATDAAKTVEQIDPAPILPVAGRLPSALLSLNTNSGLFSHYAFLVDKKARTLTVWQSAGDKIKAVESFAIDLGAHPGDKTAEGDSKTPEGIYFFQRSMDGKKLDYSSYGEHIFTTDYPNFFDRLEKKTGRGIWLHAIPDSTSLQRGSHGCVVVRNKVIEGLAKYIELKRTPMIVVDQVEY